MNVDGAAQNPVSLHNLNQFFSQFDEDHDGQVTAEQIKSIFEAVGYPSPYIGTVKKVIRLMNFNSQGKSTLNFSQLEEYAQANTSEGKLKVWKCKYQIHEAIKEAHQDLFEEQESSAAPGAGPGQDTPTGVQDSLEGQFEGKSGNSNEYSEYFKFSVQKEKGKQIKPFVKITIQRDTPQQAKRIQELFKQIYDILIELLKNQSPEFMTEIQSVSFITSVNGCMFNLFVTTGNQDLIELIQLAATYLDQIIKNPINAKLEGSYSFNFDVEKFVTNPDFNFYDMVTKNCKIHLKWNVWSIFNALRKILIKGGAFSELKYDDYEPFSMMLMSLIHTQKFSGKLEFDNVSTEVQETKSKEQISNGLKELMQEIKEAQTEMNIPIMQMISQMNGKINLEVGVGDWRVNYEMKIKNWPMIFTQEIKFTEDTSNDSD